MCWSAQVSLLFACLDTFFVALLLARKYVLPNKRPSHAGKYAALMTGVALQEWAQYFIWKRNRLGSCSDPRDIFLSFLAFGSAESLPFSLIVASTREKSVKHHHRRHMRILALILWLTQMLIVFSSAAYTGRYCVELGDNHHQVWVCESASHAAGGEPLHALFYWLYIASSVCSAESVDMPCGERRRLQGIGVVSGAASYALYGSTLEASSIWCWSACVLGLDLCAQEYGYLDALFLLLQPGGKAPATVVLHEPGNRVNIRRAPW
jgi:hypothetical protein